MMRRKGIALISTVLILMSVAATALLLKGCAKKTDSLETVRIGASASPIAGLVFIADEKGFFAQRGISPVIKTSTTGALTIDGLLRNEADVVTAAEFVFVKQSFDHDGLKTFAEIANSNAVELIARRDRGIKNLSGLKGKRIGLPRGSISEFFLGTFLRHNNIPLSNVEIVDLAPSAAEEALYSGSVDAVVVWEPYVTRIEQRLEKNSMRWPVQGRDDFYFLLIAKEEFLRRSPATLEKMLQALIDAEAFADKHPEEAYRIIDARLRLQPRDVELMLTRSSLKVRLDQGLLTLMEAETQWLIKNNLTPKKEMPNYFNMIYLKALEAVRPEAVGIIH